MDTPIQSALEKQNPWWFGKKYETGIERLSYHSKLLRYLKTPEVLLISGARRTGKSTLLYQLIKTLNVKPESILFINLDEPLFQSKAKDPIFLSTLIEEYTLQHKNIKKFYIFIDEVQNYQYWVQTIKTLYDVNKTIKFILTGSTSTLLKNTLSTRLSGRYFSTTIYPLSFQEYLMFNKISKPTLQEKQLQVKNYLRYGGFPRVVLEKDETLKQEILKNYFQTIYLKDIIYPNNLRNNKDVFDLLYFVISNISKPFSYTNIGKTLGIATETVKEYLTCAENSYLIYTINKFDHSVKKQLVNPKKIYCIDTGLVHSLSFKFSEDKGRMMENLIYLTLKRSQKDIFYHKGNRECDFLIKEGLKIRHAIQVTLSLQDERTRKREVKGLLDALDTYNLKEGIIITETEKETFVIDKKKIIVKPLYEWLEEQ